MKNMTKASKSLTTSIQAAKKIRWETPTTKRDGETVWIEADGSKEENRLISLCMDIPLTKEAQENAERIPCWLPAQEKYPDLFGGKDFSFKLKRG